MTCLSHDLRTPGHDRMSSINIPHCRAGLLLTAIALFTACELASADDARAQATARAIRQETTRAHRDAEGYALPLASSWTCGDVASPLSAGWRPANQMRLIAAGHYLLPWFAHPPLAAKPSAAEFMSAYYKEPIARARALNLPITLIATQWERLLSEPPYLGMPAAQNPNVVTPEGKVLAKVSPFGPVQPWRDVGRIWTAAPAVEQLQRMYPDPPLVVFLSNNEHSKLDWTDREGDARFVARHGENRDAAFKREQIAAGWIERYRALQDGMRHGLATEAWQRKALFVGYGSFGPPHFARWDGWIDHALPISGRTDSGPLTWDGGSPNYYTHDWDGSTDHTVWSPQIESMNYVFMLEEALRLNPRFWFELSIWDGYHADPERAKLYPAKRAVYRNAGQAYDPERYKGFVQFGMWLLRPRAVRDFRGYLEPWTDKHDEQGRVVHEGGGPYFMAIVAAVDRVHDDPILRKWWRSGTLVPNRTHQHPYQSRVPAEYKDKDRWFLLDTSLDPPRPWKQETTLDVFALALVHGTKPNREWLVYAHAPRGEKKAVCVTIPDSDMAVSIDVPVGGTFHVVKEQ